MSHNWNTETYDTKTGEGFTTRSPTYKNPSWREMTEMTHILGPLHICSLEVARTANHKHSITHSVNMCDTPNKELNEAHFPVGEVVTMMVTGEDNNWRSAIRHGVALMKGGRAFVVHCHAGIHRSTLVSSAILTLTYPSQFPTLKEAHRWVLSHRTIGWKKPDTFAMMEDFVDELRNEASSIEAFDYQKNEIPEAPLPPGRFNRVSWF